MKESCCPPELKISEIEAIPFRIPYRRVHWQAIGALDAMENILIRIKTESGLIGIGEALSTNKFNSNTLLGTTGVIKNYLVPAIIGENAFNMSRIWEKMNRARSGEVFAKSGIDIALHDLMGKFLGQPISNLMGGRVVDEVQIEGPGYGIGIMSPEEMAEVAARAVENGLTQIEIKISGSLREDVKRLKKIRSAIGSEPSIKIDMTEGYSVKGAISAIRALEEYGVDWIEQPVHHSLLQGLREVRESVTTPIVVDESATSIEDLLAVISASAADGVHIKLPVVGGFTVARKMVALAEAAHLYALPGSDTATGVGLAAVTHFAASSFFHRGIHGSPLARAVDDIVRDPTPESATALQVPIGPGLGVEVDEDKLARYAVRS